MPVSPNFKSVLLQEYNINFLQCYPNGLLKHTDLCNIFQLTAGLHAELGNISFSDMQKFHQAWVMSKIRVEILQLPKWKETVTVKTWIKSLENSRSVRCLELYHEKEKIVGCETFWVVMNTETRRPESLASAHEHFEKFPNNNATEKTFSKIDTSGEKLKIGKRKVVLSDIDIVNHVNSVKYLEWCLDLLTPNVLFDRHLKSVEMNYFREISINDIVSINIFDRENTLVFTVEKDEKICFALELNF